MTEFLILKLEGDNPRDAQITAFVEFDGEPEDAIKQGFDGEGRYVIVNWSERLESGLAHGPVEVTDPENSEVRAERAEAAQREEAERLQTETASTKT
jgi:hypothetical protein